MVNQTFYTDTCKFVWARFLQMPLATPLICLWHVFPGKHITPYPLWLRHITTTALPWYTNKINKAILYVSGSNTKIEKMLQYLSLLINKWSFTMIIKGRKSKLARNTWGTKSFHFATSSEETICKNLDLKINFPYCLPEACFLVYYYHFEFTGGKVSNNFFY